MTSEPGGQRALSSGPAALIAQIAAVALGVGGVFIDGLIFRKLFVECLPYKEMSQPPASFYAAIGEHGSVAFVLLGGVVALALWRRAAHLIPLVLTVGVPLLVLTALVIGGIRYGWSGGNSDFNAGAAIDDFVIFGGAPSAFVALCAFIINLPLWLARRRQS
jgi:hypothetical protein